ncbi:MAG: ATP-binding protein [Erysipelotrichaceae bacterium]|nr:ATP-binding protein [Erysipelotrichaceae bacterium]
MFIGRNSEKQILIDALNKDCSSFIALYGRRRVGKTDLVNSAYNNSFIFKHTGLYKRTKQDQLKQFGLSLEKKGYKLKRKLKDWAEAFYALEDYIEHLNEGKKVIFIDELSWMDTPKSDLIAAFENFWNDFCFARKDIVLIVCSSATSWMLNKVIHNKGGFYNRLTNRIYLSQFTLAECQEYVEKNNLSLNKEQILQYYMIFGGVPYYWTLLAENRGMSVSQVVDKVQFSSDAILKDELKYLFSSIFDKPEGYMKIIEALGSKKAGMTRDEIIRATKLGNTGNLSEKMEELESCGFIRKYTPMGSVKKNSLYQLIDNYILFYYQFVHDNNTQDENFWTNQINTSAINVWQGLAFERVCLLHVHQIKKKMEIAGVLSENYSLICKADVDKGVKGSQIDLLIVRKDQIINLCEMKYYNADYVTSEKEYLKIQTRINDIRITSKTRYAIQPILITTYGLVPNAYSSVFFNVVTMDDLFK